MESKVVIRTYLVITGLFTLSASVIWGINTLFMLDAGLTIFEVFLANAAFTAAMAMLEIPTGVVADTRGRRASFLLAALFLALGTLAYVGVAFIDGGLLLFCLAGVILGLGYTFYSGAVEAWLVDALKETGYEQELDRVFARASMVASVAMLLGTVAGGLLGQLDLALPYFVRAGLILMAFGVGFRTMHDLGFTPRTVRFKGIAGEMKKVASAGLQLRMALPCDPAARVGLVLDAGVLLVGLVRVAALLPRAVRRGCRVALWSHRLPLRSGGHRRQLSGRTTGQARPEAHHAPPDIHHDRDVDDGCRRRDPIVLDHRSDLPLWERSRAESSNQSDRHICISRSRRRNAPRSCRSIR